MKKLDQPSTLVASPHSDAQVYTGTWTRPMSTSKSERGHGNCGHQTHPVIHSTLASASTVSPWILLSLPNFDALHIGRFDPAVSPQEISLEAWRPLIRRQLLAGMKVQDYPEFEVIHNVWNPDNAPARYLGTMTGHIYYDREKQRTMKLRESPVPPIGYYRHSTHFRISGSLSRL
ncbi:hypothetical protein Hypma_006373 [Hypsizygus marmoreus]|uniref:Uncharacterized protein n=1 Tax=Hypsizygus marmoreus TaxID=39966 RepID=A0A369JZD5_HYPMA|nr:hypothetical protein Hypma_006373 [Hypsizygus marmoreus]